MTTERFNVLTEGWIPVVTLEGRREELGILETLLRAHELAAIRDPSPIVEFGLYRLMVAFVLDALAEVGEAPEDPLELRGLIEEGRFAPNLIKSYADRCGDVFDLFHPKRPFLQTAVDKEAKEYIAALDFAVSSGTNPIFWQHGYEISSATSIPNAARLLATLSSFATEGGSGKSPSINGAPPLYVLVRGETLHETIILNLPIPSGRADHGPVAWRNVDKVGTERFSAGVAEALTWRPRAVRLSSADQGSVRRLVFEKGDKASETLKNARKDPNVAYRYTGSEQLPVRPRPGRPVWRDAGPLALLDKGAYSRPVYGKGGKVVGQISFSRPDVVARAPRVSGKDLRLRVYGMRVKQMKVFEWFSSELYLPGALARSTRLGAALHQWIELSDKAAEELRKAVANLFPRNGASNKSALGALGRQAECAERDYWRSIEAALGPLFERSAALVEDDLDDLAAVNKAVAPWKGAICREAVRAFDRAAEDLDVDTDALERSVNARRRLESKLGGILE